MIVAVTSWFAGVAELDLELAIDVQFVVGDARVDVVVAGPDVGLLAVGRRAERDGGAREHGARACRTGGPTSGLFVS